MVVYDVAVIGGGVVGVSILYQLTNRGYSCVLLEKNKDLAAAASSGNSGIVHSGFDAAPGTHEFNFIVKSTEMMKSFVEKHNIPCRQLGAIMVAHNLEELNKVKLLHESVKTSGVTETRVLSKVEVLKLEPSLTENVVGGLLIPGEAVIDSCLYVISMAHHAIKNGARVLLKHEVLSVQKDMANKWEITTSEKPVHSKLIINAAGLYGDHVDQMGLDSSHFSIKPRQGDFIVFGKDAGDVVRHIILPIPTEKTKGVIIYPSVYGNLVIGPTADEVGKRENPTTKIETAKLLQKYGQKIIPELAKYLTFETYAGLRPATQFKDFQIAKHVDRQWITVGGIRSTGLTASMGLSHHIADLVQKDFHTTVPSEAGKAIDHTPTSWETDHINYKLGNRKYHITHKLMKIGLTEQSKL